MKSLYTGIVAVVLSVYIIACGPNPPTAPVQTDTSKACGSERLTGQLEAIAAKEVAFYVGVSEPHPTSYTVSDGESQIQPQSVDYLFLRIKYTDDVLRIEAMLTIAEQGNPVEAIAHRHSYTGLMQDLDPIISELEDTYGYIHLARSYTNTGRYETIGDLIRAVINGYNDVIDINGGWHHPNTEAYGFR